MRRLILTALPALMLPAMSMAEPPNPAVDAMEGYLMFADYHAGIIMPTQLPPEEWGNVTFVDVRDADQFADGHIRDAINIEWRELLGRRDELPTDRPVVVYCNSGSLSAQIGFALRVAGMTNVRILQGGLNDWQATHGNAGVE